MYYENRGEYIRGYIPKLKRFIYFVTFEEFIEYLREHEE